MVAHVGMCVCVREYDHCVCRACVRAHCVRVCECVGPTCGSAVVRMSLRARVHAYVLMHVTLASIIEYKSLVISRIH